MRAGRFLKRLFFRIYAEIKEKVFELSPQTERQGWSGVNLTPAPERSKCGAQQGVWGKMPNCIFPQHSLLLSRERKKEQRDKSTR